MRPITQTSVAVALFVCISSGSAGGQTTVTVGSPGLNSISQSDLESGIFDGQLFTLGPDLTLEVNDNGVVLDLGESFNDTYYSFAGSTVNVNDGGRFGVIETLVSDVELNIYEGGIANGVSINGTSAVNVLGGEMTLRGSLTGGATVAMSSGRLNTGHRGGLNSGTVTVTGGVIGRSFEVESGGTLLISGGKIDESFGVQLGGGVTFTGGEFGLNGVSISDLAAGLPHDGVFTGTMADGSVFIIGEQAFESIAPGTTTLVSSPLPVIDTTPQIVSSGAQSAGLRSGQTLTLVNGGSLGRHFAAIGATLNIEGGNVGENLETAYSTVSISGGHIGDRSELTGDYTSFFDGSVVTITGGLFSDKPHALAGSTVDISGGVFEDGFRIRRDSTVTFYGDDFQLNGSPVSDLSAGLPEGGVYTGTLADGTVFIVTNNLTGTGTGGGAQIEPDTTSLVQSPLPPPDTNPQFISAGMGPNGLRPGQSLTLSGTGSLANNFAAVGASLNIEGGTVGDLAKVAYTHVEFSGGVVDGSMSVYDGGTLNMTGGEVVEALESFAGAHVRISDGNVARLGVYDTGEAVVEGGEIDRVSASSGGVLTVRGGHIQRISAVSDQSQVTIEGGIVDRVAVNDATLDVHGGVLGDGLRALFGGVVNITGGTVGDGFSVDILGSANISGGSIGSGFSVGFQSLVNISGGAFGAGFTAYQGSEVNLLVREMFLDGTPVSLVEGVPFTITDRDGVLLSAVLDDGSAFDLTLNQNNLFGQDWIDTSATLTATLVPEPVAGVFLAVGGLCLLFRRQTVAYLRA